MFPGSLCHTWTVTKWKHFILNILLLVGGDATHIFASIFFYCCMLCILWIVTVHVKIIPDKLQVVLVMWEAFLFLLTHHHLAHVCRCVSSHLTHYHSSNIFCHAGGGVILLHLRLLLTYHHLNMSSHITHHNSHPNVTCSSICTKLQVPSSGGKVLLNTNCHQVTRVWLATPHNRQVVNLS